MSCYLVDARRTPIAPKNGMHKNAELSDLCAPLLKDLSQRCGQPQQMLLGNALGAGGNPARYVALAAGLSAPSLTIDSQCTSGLDAIIMAAHSGHDLVFAGGMESYSQRPVRAKQLIDGSLAPYLRPAFSPDNDVDMTDAAAALAAHYGISRQAQHAFAANSHLKAIAANQPDPTKRFLTPRLLARLPTIRGDQHHGLTSASIAQEADGACVVAVANEAYLKQQALTPKARIIASQQSTGCPSQPALVPIDCVRALLAKAGLSVAQIDHWQIMEAYAVQAMVAIETLGIDPERVNPTGGALARGHAIGASGAVLVEQALQAMNGGQLGVITIAAGGGLACALLIEKH